MMLAAVIQKVECVHGCGGGAEASTLAIIGFVVALMSLGLAVAAWKIGNASLKIAQEQHAEFMRELRARASLELTLDFFDQPGRDVFETDATGKVGLRWRLGIKNVGDKAASHVKINFLVPHHLGHLQFQTQAGTAAWGHEKVLQTSEELPTAAGESLPAQYLVEEVDRIDMTTSYVSFVSAEIAVPSLAGSEVAVPVKVLVWGDDVDRVSVTHEATVRRV